MSHDIRTAQSQSVCVQIVLLLVARIHYFFSSLVSFSPGRYSLDLSKYILNSIKLELLSRGLVEIRHTPLSLQNG